MEEKKMTYPVVVEKETYEKYAAIVNALGLTPQEAIAVFIRQVVITNGMPFSITTDPEKNRQPVPKKEAAKHPVKKTTIVTTKVVQEKPEEYSKELWDKLEAMMQAFEDE